MATFTLADAVPEKEAAGSRKISETERTASEAAGKTEEAGKGWYRTPAARVADDELAEAVGASRPPPVF